MTHDRIRLGEGVEFDLIRRILAAAPPADPVSVLVGPGDDCAVIRAGTLAISTDASVEGVHFRREWLGPREIGWRAAAAGLSDLAAVAARPLGLLVSLAAPPDDVPEFAAAVMEGVVECAHDNGTTLLGGDVTASPASMFLDVVVLGQAPEPVLRAGARPGDEVWVTGRLGAAAAAVVAWRRGEKPTEEARNAFARPRPRIREALRLKHEGVLTAMLDLSDGLAGDAAHLAAASGVGIVLELDRVPIAQAVRAVVGADDEAALRLALAGGEDYELCFAADAGSVSRVAQRFEEEFGLPLTRVGTVVEGAGVARREPDGSVRPLQVAGYRHFQEETP